MLTKTTISLTDARKRIFEIAQHVQNPSSYYTFTENGRPKAVLLSAEEFESWLETLQVEHECPQLHKELTSYKNDVKTGKVSKYKSIDDLV